MKADKMALKMGVDFKYFRGLPLWFKRRWNVIISEQRRCFNKHWFGSEVL